MILFNKFNMLSLVGIISLAFNLHAMIDIGPDNKPKKRNFIDALGQGHQGVVLECSPMKASPYKKSKIGVSARKGLIFALEYGFDDGFQEELSAVRKTLINPQSGDLRLEATTQYNIRELLREKFSDDRYQHIPKIDSYDSCNIKMENAQAKRLSDAMHELSIREFLNLMSNIMKFVASIHQVGYAHDDLSPSNIMVDIENLDFKIIDFELSGKIGVDIRKMSGAKEFSAPEMLQFGFVGSEADVFSLGKIMNLFFECYSAQDEINNLITDMTITNYEERITLSKATDIINTILKEDDLNYFVIMPSKDKDKETDIGYVGLGY